MGICTDKTMVHCSKRPPKHKDLETVPSSEKPFQYAHSHIYINTTIVVFKKVMQTILFCQAIFKQFSHTTRPIWGAIMNVIGWISLNARELQVNHYFSNRVHAWINLAAIVPAGGNASRTNCGKHLIELRPPMIDGVTGNVWGDQDCYVFVKSPKVLFVIMTTSYGSSISKPKEQVNEIFVLIQTIFTLTSSNLNVWFHEQYVGLNRRLSCRDSVLYMQDIKQKFRAFK